MIHFKKILFYLFLLVALSAASATAVLKLSDRPLLSNAFDVDSPRVVYETDDAAAQTVDSMVDETNRMIVPDVHVSLVSKPSEVFTAAESDNSFAEEPGMNVDSSNLAENASEVADEVLDTTASLFDDDAILEVDSELFVDSAPDILGDETTTSDDARAGASQNDSGVDFVALAAVRDSEAVAVESEDDEIIFDSNETSKNEVAFEDEDFDALFEEGNDASLNDLLVADDLNELEADEIVFDSNDVVDEDEDELFASDVETIVEEADEIVFDSNDVVDEDEDELFASDVETIVEEADEIVFDSNDVADVDEDELFASDVETIVEEADEIVFDSNDVVDEDEDELFASDVETIVEEEDEVVFDSNDVADDEVDEDDLFDDNSEAVVEEESDKELNEDSLLAGETGKLIEETVDEVATADSNELAEDESDENDYSELIGDAYFKEENNGESDEIIFDSNETAPHVDELPDVENLEKEADFFDSDNLAEPKSEENTDETGAEVDKNKSAEAIKADDMGAYTDEVVYDSNATEAPEKKEYELAPNETLINGDETIADAVNGSEAARENQAENLPVPPCAPVCKPGTARTSAPTCGVTPDVLIVAETLEEGAANEENHYYRAPVTIKTSSESIPDVVQKNSVGDELWIVSQGVSGNHCWSFENGSWIQKDSKSFFSSDDPRRVTLFWAHGYQTDMSSAAQSGFILKSVLDRSRSATGIDRKYRIVIWKWDSERDYVRIRVDAKEKRDLAYYCGSELGKFAGRLNPKDDVVFIGFSFGAVVTGSALQTLATTSNAYVNGHNATAFATSGATTETATEEQIGRVSLILMNAACDLGSFNRGGCFSSGATLPTRVLNVYNPADYALKFYPMISATSQAMGIAPLSGNEFVNAIGGTYNVNTNGVLGKEHSFDDALPLIPPTTLAGIVF